MARQGLFFGRILLDHGWARDVRIDVADGCCAAITAGVSPASGDERHAVGIPGLPNLHSHAFQRGMAGLTERRGVGDDSFWNSRALTYRFVDRLTPDDLRAIAAQAYVEMLESGFTRVGEFHYLHHDVDGGRYGNPALMAEAIAAAAADSGLALTLLPVFYAHGGFGGAPPEAGHRRFVNGIDAFASLVQASRTAVGALPDAVVGVAPHSLPAVTAGQLAAVAALVPAGPIHLRVAEQVGEVEACLAWSGARPVEWLLDHADIDARWCAVHATHMTDAETAALARSGAVAGLCPITEANRGDGLFPAGSYLAAGGAFGIGSDGNVRIDASEELRLLEYGQRLNRRTRNVIARGAGASTGETMFVGALAGGGTALGMPATLRVGAAADIVSLDAAHPALAGAAGAATLDAWIFAAGRDAIDCVWRRGEKLVTGGRHRDRRAIGDRYRATMRLLLA